MAWSEKYGEIASAHGHSSNQIVLWRCRNRLEKVAVLEAHKSRVIDMAMSPDKTTILTSGADDELRVYACFAADKDEDECFIAGKKKNNENPSQKHGDGQALMR